MNLEIRADTSYRGGFVGGGGISLSDVGDSLN
jgi:hypothetical protein